MTSTDYILDLALIGLVFLQMRGRRLSAVTLLLPFAIVGYVAAQYLHGIPTAGNDLVLVAGGTALGLLLGGLCAVFTKLTPAPEPGGYPFARAGALAAICWVVGVGARFAFQMYVTHGGEDAIGRFSQAHDITSGSAWAACIILMAIGEVAARSGGLALRAYRMRSAAATPVSAGSAAAAVAPSTSRAFGSSIMGAGEQSH